MSENWIVQNLEYALNIWNEKLSEIWTLLTTSPQAFKGGAIWDIVTNIHRCITSNRFCITCFIFCYWSNKNLWFIYRSKAT